MHRWDPDDARVAEQHINDLEVAADRLAVEWDGYRAASDAAHRFRIEQDHVKP